MTNSLHTRLLFPVIFSLFFFCNSAQSFSHTKIPQEKISSSTLLDSSIKLDKEWLFYWNEFFVPENLQLNDSTIKPILVEVPNFWNSYKINGKPLGRIGYATYVKQLVFDNSLKDAPLSLKISAINSSYKIFIDNKLAQHSGVTGTSKEESEPVLKTKVVNFSAKDTITISIQVANFHMPRGGIWSNIYLGHQERIKNQLIYSNIIGNISSFLLFTFILIFLYYYYLFPTRKGVFWLALLILGALLEDLGVSFVITHPLLTIPWSIMMRLKHLGIILIIFSAGFCFDFYFPSSLTKRVNKWSIFLFIIYILFISIFSPFYFARSVYFLYSYAVVIFSVVFKAIISQEKNSAVDSISFTVSMLLILVGAINDILVFEARPLLFSGYILKYCFSIYLFTILSTIMRISAKNFNSAVRLKSELYDLNQNLENQILIRTEELNKQKKEAVRQHEIIMRNNVKLEADLSFKHRLFSIIGHDLRSHTGSLMQMTEVMQDNSFSDNFKNNVQKIMYELAPKIFNLVENLLFWGRSQNNELVSYPTEFDLKAKIENSLDLFSNMITRKKMTVKLNTGSKLLLFADKDHMEIIIRNLISNAIKFSNEGGKIIINAYLTDENVLKIEFNDSGIGMTNEQINSILKSDQFIESTNGTLQEKGTGIGLQLCRDLIQLNKGEFGINSSINAGTTIWIKFPISKA